LPSGSRRATAPAQPIRGYMLHNALPSCFVKPASAMRVTARKSARTPSWSRLSGGTHVCRVRSRILAPRFAPIRWCHRRLTRTGCSLHPGGLSPEWKQRQGWVTFRRRLPLKVGHYCTPTNTTVASPNGLAFRVSCADEILDMTRITNWLVSNRPQAAGFEPTGDTNDETHCGKEDLHLSSTPQRESGAERRRTLASDDSGAGLTTQAWKPLRPAPRVVDRDRQTGTQSLAEAPTGATQRPRESPC